MTSDSELNNLMESQMIMYTEEDKLVGPFHEYVVSIFRWDFLMNVYDAQRIEQIESTSFDIVRSMRSDKDRSSLKEETMTKEELLQQKKFSSYSARLRKEQRQKENEEKRKQEKRKRLVESQQYKFY